MNEEDVKNIIKDDFKKLADLCSLLNDISPSIPATIKLVITKQP